jgi:hypothetical protein
MAPIPWLWRKEALTPRQTDPVQIRTALTKESEVLTWEDLLLMKPARL